MLNLNFTEALHEKRQTVLGGSLLLLASAAAAKLLGEVFRIPLTAMLGGSGMGYFSCAYGLFLPIFSRSVTGMNTAAAVLTARLLSRGDQEDAAYLLRLTRRCFGAIGLLGALMLFLLSEPICTHLLHNRGALSAVRCFAPAVFFCCINAVYRGAWEGRQDMRPTALSQTAESAAKLLLGIALFRYAQTHADALILHLSDSISRSELAAAAAILGVTLSTAAGTVCLRCFSLPHAASAPLHHSKKELACELFRILIPVSAVALVTNLTALIDLAFGIRGPESALRSNPAALPAGSIAAEQANFLFGAFSGLAVTIFSLVPSMTNMLGKGVLSAFSKAHAQGDEAAEAQHLRDALTPMAFLAIPAGLGISAVISKFQRICSEFLSPV